MANNKKTTRKSTTTSKTAAAKKSGGTGPKRTGRPGCPNPGKPQGLRVLIKRMAGDRNFAILIGDLLCDYFNNNSEEAKECLMTYINFEDGEPGKLCLPKSVVRTCEICTDQWALLAPSAYAFSA